MKKFYLLATAGLLSVGAFTTSTGLAQADLPNEGAKKNMPMEMESMVRLAQAEQEGMPMPMKDMENGSGKPIQSQATVRQVDAKNRKVTLAHEPIPEWGWPRMTMTFDVSEDVNMNELQEGSEIEFTAVRPEGGSQVVVAVGPVE